MKIVQRLIEECKHRYNLYFNYMPFFQEEMKKETIKEFNENEVIEDLKKTNEIMKVEKEKLLNRKKVRNGEFEKGDKTKFKCST